MPRLAWHLSVYLVRAWAVSWLVLCPCTAGLAPPGGLRNVAAVTRSMWLSPVGPGPHEHPRGRSRGHLESAGDLDGPESVTPPRSDDPAHYGVRVFYLCTVRGLLERSCMPAAPYGRSLWRP